MKKFLGEFFIAFGIVIAAGAGILFLASAAFGVDIMAELTGRNPEPEDVESSESSYVESFSPDDPWLAAALEQRKSAQGIAEGADDAEEGEGESGAESDSNLANSEELEEQERIASYIAMDGTYSAAISGAGGSFKRVIAGSGKDQESAEVTFTFAGDILFSGDYATGIQAGTVGIENCFDEGTMELMRSADVFMVNNEFQYTTEGTPVPDKKYTLRANPGTVDWLKVMGADIVSLANNHMFDFQEVGLQDTLNTLRSANMPYVGAGENIEEASSTAYIHLVTSGVSVSGTDEEAGSGSVASAEED